MPVMTVEHHAVACRTNPLGVKGTGEAGTTAAPPALMNAILDALPNGAQLDMPATPDRIWQALQGVGDFASDPGLRRMSAERSVSPGRSPHSAEGRRGNKLLRHVDFHRLVIVSQCFISPLSQVCASASDLLGTTLKCCFANFAVGFRRFQRLGHCLVERASSTGFGVAAGANSAFHATVPTSAKPASCMVGTSG